DLRQIEANVENIRQAHYEAGEQVNLAQGHLYQASAEVGRLEAEIRFVVEGRERAKDRLAQIQNQIQQWTDQAAQSLDAIEKLHVDHSGVALQINQLQATQNAQQSQIPILEVQSNTARQALQDQSQLVNQVQQQMKVLAAEQSGLQEQSRQLQIRLDRLQNDHQSLKVPDEQQLSLLQQQFTLAEQLSAQSQAQLDSLEASLESIEADRKRTQQTSNEEAAKLVELQARHQALKALQEKLRSDEKLMPWLNKHGLQTLQPLWGRVHVTPGWEQALESALRERIAALEVSQIDIVKAFANDSPLAKLSFFSPVASLLPTTPSPLPKLFEQIRLSDAKLQILFSDWLNGCFTAKNL
ncbi:MAG: chromosome segregation protein SMC, partial [Limnohabitans sp.]